MYLFFTLIYPNMDVNKVLLLLLLLLIRLNCKNFHAAYIDIYNDIFSDFFPNSSYR